MKQCLLSALQLAPIRRSVFSSLLLIVVSGAVQPASAAPILYTRAAFDAAFPGAVTEPWEAYAPGTVFPDGTTTNGITYSVNNGDAIVTNAFLASTSPNTLGRTASNFFQNGDVATFSFNDPLSAFGIDFNTFANNAGAYTATTSAGEVITSMFDPFPGLATGQFLGFSTTLPFASISISNGASPAAYNLDTLRSVVGAPEPDPIAITCGFGPEGSGGSGCGDSENPYSNTFTWEEYLVELTLVGGFGNFDITMTDNPMDESEFDERESVPGEYDCVPMVDPTGDPAPCRDFDISAPRIPQWLSYDLKILWDFDTNEDFPDGIDPDGDGPLPGQIRVLQNPSADFSDSYTIDMCLTYLDHPCEYFPQPRPGDPGIRSGDTVFSSITVARAQTPASAPEPSSLILVGSAVTGFLYRRGRRRREESEAPPRA